MAVLADIVTLRVFEVQMIVGSLNQSMGDVFAIRIYPDPVVSKRGWNGDAFVKGYDVLFEFESNQNSDEFIRLLPEIHNNPATLNFSIDSTSRAFSISGKHLIVDAPLDGTNEELLWRYRMKAKMSVQAFADLTPPDAIYAAFIERSNHDFSMLSEESTFSITAVSKTADPQTPNSTGYIAKITTNVPHGYIGNKLVNINIPAESLFNGDKAIKVINATQFSFPVSGSANGSASVSGATCKQQRFHIYHRIDSRLIVKAVVAGNHDVEVWVRNYLLPEDYQSGDWSLKDHASFKSKQFHIQAVTDQADAIIASTGWGIGGMVIQNTFDVASGTSWQLLATTTISAANFALMTGAYV